MKPRTLLALALATAVVAVLPEYVSASEQCLETNRLDQFSFVKSDLVRASLVDGRKFDVTMNAGCARVGSDIVPVMEDWKLGRCIDAGDFVILSNGGVCTVESVTPVSDPS